MSTDSDLTNLKAKLQRLIGEFHSEITATADLTEGKRLSSALDLPQLALLRINAYLAGDRNVLPRDIFQSMIGNCTRGFAEIGADATETPGRINDMIKEILEFCITCQRAYQ